MKPPTFAPAYVGLFPILAEVAQQHGYALAVHGSVSRDFDLVAIPWADQVASAEALIRAIAERMSYTMDTAITVDRLFKEPYCETKPHGRRSWAIPLDCGAVIDISVMPLPGGLAWRVRRLSCDGGSIGKTFEEEHYATKELAEQRQRELIQASDERNPKYKFCTEPVMIDRVTGFCNWQFGVMIAVDSVDVIGSMRHGKTS